MEIVALVTRYGPNRWSVIASSLPGRNGKQCRERWHNQLDPKINTSAWTEAEDITLIEAQREVIR